MNCQTQGPNNTIQHCIISEALANPLHPKGPHSKGFLIFAQGKTQAQNVLAFGNLLAWNKARNPCVNGYASAVVANNAIFDGNAGMICDSEKKPGQPLRAAFIKNSIKRVRVPFVVNARGDNNTKPIIYYGSDNMVNGRKMGSFAVVWKKVFFFKRGVAPESSRAKTPPVTVPGLKFRSVEKVEKWVLANAGARPADRDPVDKRIVKNVKSGKGKFIASQKEVGGWPPLKENHHKLKLPRNPNGDDDRDGYTNLEEWLHEFAAKVEGRGK